MTGFDRLIIPHWIAIARLAGLPRGERAAQPSSRAPPGNMQIGNTAYLAQK